MSTIRKKASPGGGSKAAKRKRNAATATLEELEICAANARIKRSEETRARNAAGQNLPPDPKRTKRAIDPKSSLEESDSRSFFGAIDQVFLRICGSCGELAKATRAYQKCYDPNSKYFRPLKNQSGLCEVINEAITYPDSTGAQFVWFCNRCHTSLLKQEVPKFSRASGFRIEPIPSELAVLNRMEARLVGLGISFTTCINLYRDQQEFTRGNAINYWNDIQEMATSLPRPLSKSGVVLLQSKDSNGNTFIRVRPELIRRALQWLINNNPLYAHVSISEEALAEMSDINARASIPELSLNDDEVSALRLINDENANGIRTPSSPSDCKDGETAAFTPTTRASESAGSSVDETFDITESFELEADGNGNQTETEKLKEAVNTVAGRTLYPTGELPDRKDAINEYTTKRLMQSCFPVLFPNGEGGFHPIDEEDRLQDYSLAEYCAHIMKWHDRRFVIHGNFKFFCLNLIQRRQIDGLVRRVSIRQDNDSIADTSDQYGSSITGKVETNKAMVLLEALKPYFRGVRGSGLYWANVKDDLMAMIGNRVLPSRWPTFFLTLSAADTIWPDFFRACNPELSLEQARNLTSRDRRRYLSENPDIAARHFDRRFKSFFDTVLCGKAQPLGEIVDYFWRIEFQQRGSPHIHALLWVGGAPDVLKLSESELGRHQLASYVDNVISVMAKTPEELDKCSCATCASAINNKSDILASRPPVCRTKEWDCDLARVINRVQRHVCFPGATCRKRGDECRFGYPKELEDHTKIECDNSVDGIASVKIRLKRQDPSVNNYCPLLLSVWRANMDIQLIGNAYGAAEYTAAYVSKAEPDTLRFKRIIAASIKRCDPNMPQYATLKKVANATLSIREVSAQEAYYILLRELPMHGKSRQITRVKVMRHHKRYYRIEREELLSTKTVDAIRIEKVEAAYMARPIDPPFDNMTLASFVEKYDFVDNPCKYEACWKRLDDGGYIKLRAKAHVVRGTPWITPDSSNPDYCFAEIFLHKPWRQLTQLPQTDEDCTRIFQAEQDLALRTELAEESSLTLSRHQNIDLLRAQGSESRPSAMPESEYVFIEQQDDIIENFVDRTPPTAGHVAVPWTPKHSYSVDQVKKAIAFVKNYIKPWIKMQREIRNRENCFGCHQQVTKSSYIYPIDNAGAVMDESQWVPFALAMNQSRKRFQASCDNSFCEPMQMIIQGEGGSGKSWLIKHIVKDVHNVFREHSASRRTSKRVLLLAHQGTAAFNIKGQTICSAFELTSYSRNAYSVPYTSLTGQKGGATKLKKMQERFHDVHLVIIDEFSVISCGMLYWIDQRMREIWPKCSHLLFGGRDVIFTGDPAQLDPVIPYALSMPITRIMNSTQRLGRQIWEGIQCVCCLAGQNRGKLDPEWFSALRRLRCGCTTHEDVALFNSRYRSRAEMPDWGQTAKHIAYRNVDVNEANSDSLASSTSPIISVPSKHSVQLKRLAKQREISKATVLALQQEAETPDSNRDRVVGTQIRLCIGAPVTLTFNMEQSAGLCNGTNGVVYDVIAAENMDVPIVLVQITDLYIGPSFLADVPNIVPIIPKKISWSKKTSDLSVYREGVPLRLAYAITVHKVQGLTCTKVVFHSLAIPSVSFAYVALSRVRTREDLVLTMPLTIDKLTLSADKRAALNLEDQRISVAVHQTATSARETILAMQQVALAHNQSMRPR